MEDEMSTLVRRSSKRDPNSGSRFIYTSTLPSALFLENGPTYEKAYPIKMQLGLSLSPLSIFKEDTHLWGLMMHENK